MQGLLTRTGVASSFARASQPLRVLVVLELATVLFLGSVTVARYPLWDTGDEAAHFSYVKSVWDDRRLPVISDPLQPEVVALRQGTYPAPPRSRPEGIGARSYEAFQPPLYYVLAAPVYAVPFDERQKARVLRVFGLFLVLISIGVVFRFSRRVCGENHVLPFATALSSFLWPGVLVRLITVSNAALELLAALVFLHILWRADAEEDRRMLVWAGVALGLALLTKLTLVFLAVLFGGVCLRALLRRRDAGTAAAVLVAALLPVLLLAPWAAFNQDRYGALTANAAAREQQGPYILPGSPQFGVGDAVERLPKLLEGFLPQEWDPNFYLPDLDSPADLVPLLLLVPVMLLFAVAPRRMGSREALLLGLPLLLAVMQIAVTLVAADWDTFFPRYLYSVTPGLALLAGIATSRLFSARWAVVYTWGLFLVSAGAWVYLAGRYLFTDVGRAIGIG